MHRKFQAIAMLDHDPDQREASATILCDAIRAAKRILDVRRDLLAITTVLGFEGDLEPIEFIPHSLMCESARDIDAHKRDCDELERTLRAKLPETGLPPNLLSITFQRHVATLYTLAPVPFWNEQAFLDPEIEIDPVRQAEIFVGMRLADGQRVPLYVPDDRLHELSAHERLEYEEYRQVYGELHRGELLRLARADILYLRRIGYAARIEAFGRKGMNFSHGRYVVPLPC